MRFDLTDLRLFLSVVEVGSITRGAADVGLSLAAASDRLREMEAVGQVFLLKRGRRGVALTEAGEALALHAREILYQASLMHLELGRFAKGLRATVRVLANTAAIVDVLPKRLSPWLAAHPQVDVDLRERQSHEVARSVGAGFADLGVLSNSFASEELLCKPFAVSKLVVISAPSHWLAPANEVRLSHITDEYFVGLEEGALQAHIEAQASSLASRIRYRLKLRTFEGICRAVGTGAGVAVVPSTVAARYSRSIPIAVTPLSDVWAKRHLSVCIAATRKVPPIVIDLFNQMACS